MSARSRVFSVGHSSHSLEKFIELLQGFNVTAIADVRSSPRSRYNQHFNRDELKTHLGSVGISYVFLGRELGGRPRSPDLYTSGVADYEKMAREADYINGIGRLLRGAEKFRIAIMCAEQDPLDCHRCLLVSRSLGQQGVQVEHILADGSMVTHAEVEERLLRLCRLSGPDLFSPFEERLENAYRERARRVAFSELSDEEDGVRR